MVFQTQARRKDFLFRQIKPPIHPDTNLKLKLAQINEIIEAEIEVVERIKMEDWVFKCFFCVSLFLLL